MSRTTVLGVIPDRRPVVLAELANGWGWSASIWDRLVRAHRAEVLPGPGSTLPSWLADRGGRELERLWQSIEELPEWQQAPLVLTFDTGIIPWQAYEWAADQLEEFDRRLPAPPHHVNHVPAVAALLRSRPEVPMVGVWATSVAANPFDPWDEEADHPGSGIPLSAMCPLERHYSVILADWVGAG